MVDPRRENGKKNGKRAGSAAGVSDGSSIDSVPVRRNLSQEMGLAQKAPKYEGLDRDEGPDKDEGPDNLVVARPPLGFRLPVSGLRLPARQSP